MHSTWTPKKGFINHKSKNNSYSESKNLIFKHKKCNMNAFLFLNFLNLINSLLIAPRSINICMKFLDFKNGEKFDSHLKLWRRTYELLLVIGFFHHCKIWMWIVTLNSTFINDFKLLKIQFYFSSNSYKSFWKNKC